MVAESAAGCSRSSRRPSKTWRSKTPFARSAGSWAYPEDWGTWACHAGGELALGLATNQSQTYFVCLRLRASGPMIEHPIRISADGETVWHNSIGPRPRNIVLRVRRRAAGKEGWRLRLRAETDLSPELQSKIATEDSRIPTIGFERLVIVPGDDLKTRVDILLQLLLRLISRGLVDGNGATTAVVRSPHSKNSRERDPRDVNFKLGSGKGILDRP